jgi:enoyl-CoA hydratase/carnithine racemase
MSAIWGDEQGEPAPVLSEVREGVAVVTLNRPKRLNAWTPAMGSLYFSTLERLARDPSVRSILVTGQGRAFCAGIDLGGLANLAASGGSSPPAEPDLRPYWLPMSIGKPIVAAIRGPCFGVGLQQVLCCDIRFAADDVKLSAPYSKRGLIGEVGMTWNLTRVIGAGAAMDLMLSGRTLEAEEAFRVGLVNRIIAADKLFDEAFAYCRALAGECSPWSMMMIKQQIYKDLMVDMHVAYRRSEEMMTQALAGNAIAEGLTAFREKRPPVFPPLSGDQATIDLSREAS